MTSEWDSTINYLFPGFFSELKHICSMRQRTEGRLKCCRTASKNTGSMCVICLQFAVVASLTWSILHLEYCHNLLDAACEHHLWTCKRTYYCQVVSYPIPPLSLSFCLSWQSWHLMSFFLLWCVWDLLVPNTAVTSAFFRFSSGKTGHISPRPEFAFRKDSNLFAQPILSSTCLHVCWWFSTNSAMHTDTSHIFCVHQNLSCHL